MAPVSPRMSSHDQAETVGLLRRCVQFWRPETQSGGQGGPKNSKGQTFLGLERGKAHTPSDIRRMSTWVDIRSTHVPIQAINNYKKSSPACDSDGSPPDKQLLPSVRHAEWPVGEEDLSFSQRLCCVSPQLMWGKTLCRVVFILSAIFNCSLSSEINVPDSFYHI